MAAAISAIVYSSSTGFTRRYAQLLAQRTGLPAYDLAQNDGPGQGAAVVYLGWLRAGQIMGLKRAAKRYALQAVGVVGMAPEPNGKALEELDLPVFYLRGGYDPRRLTGLSALMMKPMTAMMTRRPPKDEAGRAMQEAFLHGGDWVDPEALTPLAGFCAGH